MVGALEGAAEGREGFSRVSPRRVIPVVASKSGWLQSFQKDSLFRKLDSSEVKSLLGDRGPKPDPYPSVNRNDLVVARRH
jgi:hypothetical protein